jgi:uncharacterized protein (UPF0548 family)
VFLASRPSEEKIRQLITAQRDAPFSYNEVGATRGEFPAGYGALRADSELGRGENYFTKACAAVREWKMFEVPNLRLHFPATPIEAGNVVAVLARHFGFWSLNFCRIVYVVDEDGPVRRFGFAYGTLREHAERGEERFVVEWDRNSDRVSYHIASFSRPAGVVVLAAPIARLLQKQFLRESVNAMRRATTCATSDKN